MMRINNRNHYLRVICLYLQRSPVPRVPLISPRLVMSCIITRLQPVISDIYHIHYDHNALRARWLYLVMSYKLASFRLNFYLNFW